MYGDSVDAFEACTEAERALCHDAARLEELADDAARLSEGSFEDGSSHIHPVSVGKYFVQPEPK